ncbi:MAG: hypothetical protein Tsb0013_12830 [Phycisphaerales bacterium]
MKRRCHARRLYSLPVHQVRIGDWLELAPSLAPGSADMLYADPPFNSGRTHTGTAGSFDDRFASTDDYVEWLRARLEATLPALTPDANILIHCDWRTSHLVRLLLDGLLGPEHFVNHIVWSYGLGGSSPRRFARKHDDILFYTRDPDTYFFDPPMVPATSNRMRGERKKATDVLDIPAINNMAKERTGWPTQKPLALLELLVRACCPEGGTVLDPCCGSGTTLVAAVRNRRSAIGFDRDERAAAVSLQRLSAHHSPA